MVRPRKQTAKINWTILLAPHLFDAMSGTKIRYGKYGQLSTIGSARGVEQMCIA